MVINTTKNKLISTMLKVLTKNSAAKTDILNDYSIGLHEICARYPYPSAEVDIADKQMRAPAKFIKGLRLPEFTNGDSGVPGILDTVTSFGKIKNLTDIVNAHEFINYKYDITPYTYNIIICVPEYIKTSQGIYIPLMFPDIVVDYLNCSYEGFTTGVLDEYLDLAKQPIPAQFVLGYTTSNVDSNEVCLNFNPDFIEFKRQACDFAAEQNLAQDIYNTVNKENSTYFHSYIKIKNGCADKEDFKVINDKKNYYHFPDYETSYEDFSNLGILPENYYGIVKACEDIQHILTLFDITKSTEVANSHATQFLPKEQ